MNCSRSLNNIKKRSAYVVVLFQEYSELYSQRINWWENLECNYLSRRMEKNNICIGERKGADQLRSDCEADQCLCFRYMDSTIPLLSKSKILSL